MFLPNFCAIEREGGADAGVEHFRIEAGDARLLGQRQRIRRIAEGDEDIRIERLHLVDDRREILRADRIALVVGELEFRVGERRPRRRRQIDAEAVGDADHRDRVADLLFIAQFVQQFDQRLRGIGAGAEHPETVGPALCEFRRAVGHGRRGEVRIAFAVERRANRQIEAGAPWRQDEIDLVLVDQPLQRAHGLFGVGAVVVLHDLDRDALVAELDATGGIHFLHPQFVVGDRGDGGAAGVRAGASKWRSRS